MKPTNKRHLLGLSVFLSAMPIDAASVRIRKIESVPTPVVETAGVPEPVKSRPVGPRTGGSQQEPSNNHPQERAPEKSRSPVKMEPIRTVPGGSDSHRTSTGGGSSISRGERTRVVRNSSSPAPERHGVVAGNTKIIRSIEKNRHAETAPNKRYWHDVGGSRYCHTYRHGKHWYGFYFGSYFYWTRYHSGYWWWYDPSFGWVYWSNGYWWWPSPGGRPYVYFNNSYYPYESAPTEVTIPEPPAAVVAASDEANGSWKSPDGKRMVQIHGPQSEAFLYDITEKSPIYMAYLGQDVERVRFSGFEDGRPVRILLDFKNGEFAFLSSEGLSVDPELPDVPDVPIDPPPVVPAEKD